MPCDCISEVRQDTATRGFSANVFISIILTPKGSFSLPLYG